MTIVVTEEDTSLVITAFGEQGPAGIQGPEGPAGPPGVGGPVVYDGGTPETDFSVGFNINCGGVT